MDKFYSVLALLICILAMLVVIICIAMDKKEQEFYAGDKDKSYKM